MTKAQLLEYANDSGIDGVSMRQTKAAMIEIIEAAE